MKVFITGAGGQLGHDLIRVLAGKHAVTAKSRAGLDVTDTDAVRRELQAVRPDVIIHAAAYTQVDLAESRIEDAYAVNAFGSCNVAMAAKEIGAKLVYVSTDYVFDGKKGAPYDEQDQTNPISVYGNSKLQGEKFIQHIGEKYFIIRTSWLYGKHGSNFVTKVLALAERHSRPSMVNDQFGSPTYTYDLAQFIGRVMETEHYGVYHASNRGCCSRYEFAAEILRIAGLGSIQLLPVGADSFPLPAARPQRSDFGDEAIRKYGFPRLRTWQEALASFMLDDLGVVPRTLQAAEQGTDKEEHDNG
jgi:dTDP-4-dehydrorhamnose reductase